MRQSFTNVSLRAWVLSEDLRGWFQERLAEVGRDERGAFGAEYAFWIVVIMAIAALAAPRLWSMIDGFLTSAESTKFDPAGG